MISASFSFSMFKSFHRKAKKINREENWKLVDFRAKTCPEGNCKFDLQSLQRKRWQGFRLLHKKQREKMIFKTRTMLWVEDVSKFQLSRSHEPLTVYWKFDEITFLLKLCARLIRLARGSWGFTLRINIFMEFLESFSSHSSRKNEESFEILIPSRHFPWMKALSAIQRCLMSLIQVESQSPHNNVKSQQDWTEAFVRRQSSKINVLRVASRKLRVSCKEKTSSRCEFQYFHRHCCLKINLTLSLLCGLIEAEIKIQIGSMKTCM